MKNRWKLVSLSRESVTKGWESISWEIAGVGRVGVSLSAHSRFLKQEIQMGQLLKPQLLEGV